MIAESTLSTPVPSLALIFRISSSLQPSKSIIWVIALSKLALGASILLIMGMTIRSASAAK